MQDISIILCRPQLHLNVGACARVMCNMGYSDLRIVNPRDKDIVAKAYESASHSGFILDNSTIYETLDDAVADLEYVAMTSARPRDLEKKVCMLDDLVLNFDKFNKIGMVFGPERTGLTNQELTIADIIVQIKTGEGSSSYNLSHAVAIVMYEIFNKKNPSKKMQKDNLANKKEINYFLTELELLLDENGYFKESNKKNGQSLNIKNIFTRDYFTKQDIKTLHGIINFFKKQ